MDYAAHLQSLRESYYRATPQQRLGVARQRIKDPDHGPNLLVTHISAIEGLLRSLVIWAETPGGRPSAQTYENYKRCGVNDLYQRYLALKQCAPLVSESEYQLVKYAVEYRNLLAHECTYLGQEKYLDLVKACTNFFEAIVNNAGINHS